MAHDDGVRPHRAQRVQRVHQRFALGDAGCLRGDRNRVRAQAFRREFKTGARAGGVLKEQIHHHASLQQIELAEALAGTHLEMPRAVQDGLHLVARQVFNAQKALHGAF